MTALLISVLLNTTVYMQDQCAYSIVVHDKNAANVCAAAGAMHRMSVDEVKKHKWKGRTDALILSTYLLRQTLKRNGYAE